MKYKVRINEHKESEEVLTYEVEADSEDEAIDMAFEGEGKLVDAVLIYEDVLSNDLDECVLIYED